MCESVWVRRDTTTRSTAPVVVTFGEVRVSGSSSHTFTSRPFGGEVGANHPLTGRLAPS